ncbi:MAG: GumC family protein [Kofleriaceae bacterium]
MAPPPLTPRDKAQRLVDLFRKTMRNWWLIAVFAVIGIASSLAFVMLIPPKYQSWSTIVHQNVIKTQFLTPNMEASAQRNIGDRFRELLLARTQLEKIIADPKLNPFPNQPDKEIAIDELRLAIKFESKGADVFRISYIDHDPERARDVTDRLTKQLQDKEEELRKNSATQTVAFATKQKQAVEKLLRESNEELAHFLAEHPEFALDTTQAGVDAGQIRGVRNQPKAPEGGENAYLERQRRRLLARLNAPQGAPIRIVAPPSPERQAAEEIAREAQRDVTSANRELEEMRRKYTESHPDVQKAKKVVDDAVQKLRRAQAAIPAEVETVVAPATAEDRAKLQRELNQIEAQIASNKRGSAQTGAANAIVKLETEHVELRRRVQEQREALAKLSDAAYLSQITAAQETAEQGQQISIQDPAFKPTKPTGPGKTVFMIAGFGLFLLLGTGLALLFAVIDDRLYRRTDLEALGVAVLSVVPPIRGRRPKRRTMAKEAA